MSRVADAVRRALDVTVASASLVVGAPLVGAVALAVRATSPGPVLLRHQRVGRGGRYFQLLRFRAPRGVGAVLRRWKLDALPALVNVVRGDMSLVGPAPEVPRFVARYSDAERAVLRVRPGLADPAALDAGDAEAELARFADRRRGYEQCVLPQKLARSLAYLERRTLASDVGVLARTAVRIVRGPARPAPADTTTEAGFSTAHSAGLRQEES